LTNLSELEAGTGHTRLPVWLKVHPIEEFLDDWDRELKIPLTPQVRVVQSLLAEAVRVVWMIHHPLLLIHNKTSLLE